MKYRRDKESRKESLKHLVGKSIETAKGNPAVSSSSMRDSMARQSKADRYGGRVGASISFDIEVTGLKSEMHFNPSELAWKNDLDFLTRHANGLDAVQKLSVARKLQFYKYYKESGLSQLAFLMGGTEKTRKSIQAKALADRKGFFQSGPRRQDVGFNAYVYHTRRGSSPEDYLKSLARGDVNASVFAEEQGIFARTAKAMASGDALQEADAVTEWVRALSAADTKNDVMRLVGHNVWFDIMGMQAFMVKHGERLLEQGLDPFLMINKYQAGNLVADATEEYFFDVLRAKGLRDRPWSKKFLKFGKMADVLFAQDPGVIPGAEIDLLKDAKRRGIGQQSFLRGRAGWGLEFIEQNFLRYMHLSEDEIGVPYRKFKAAGAHDALYDMVIANAVKNRFGAVADNISKFESLITKTNATNPEGFRAGKLAWEHVELLAFARSGLLGDQLAGKGMSDAEFASWLVKGDKHRLAQGRLNTLYTAWQGRSAGEVKASEAIGAHLYPGGKAQRRAQQAGHKGIDYSKKAIRKIGGLSPLRKGALGIITAAAVGGALWARDQVTRPSYNEPPNYIPGQQSITKGVQVPWASPWMGIEIDADKATGLLTAGAVIGAYYSAPVLLNKSRMGKRILEHAYIAARVFEDVTPMRLGRLAGISSHLGASLAPENYIISTSKLSGTDLGGMFARGMGVDEQLFQDYLFELSQAHNKYNQGMNDPYLSFKRSRMGFVHEIDFADESLTRHLHDLIAEARGNPEKLKRISRIQRLLEHTRKVKLQQATSRRGRSFAAYGTPEASARMNMPGWRTEQYTIDAFRNNPIMKLLGKIPGFKGAYRRYTGIPKWDADPVNRHYRWNQPQHQVWTPSYEGAYTGVKRALKTGDRSGLLGVKRLVGGTLYDWHRSAWGLLRQQGAWFGRDIGPAPSMRIMGRKLGKAAIAVAAVVGAYRFFDDSTDGQLSRATYWNMRDRISLAHARISDKLGFTNIRKRHEDVSPFAIGGILATPFLGLATAAWGRRAFNVVARDAPRQYEYLRNKQNFEWRQGSKRPVSEFGFRRGRSSFKPGGNLVGIRAIKFFTDKVGPGQKPTRGLKWLIGNRRLNMKGKIAGGVWGAAAALFIPFLGSKETYQERKAILSGEKKVEIRKGRFWEFGATPYAGGKTAYYRYHQSVRSRVRGTDEVPGESGGIGALLRSIRDPYWREKESYRDRPYPITGAPFEEVPFIGPLLAGTIGRFFKPPKLMHTDEWRAGQPYEPYGPELAPNAAMGGLPAETPGDPLGIKGQIREGVYRATEFMGLRGYLLQSKIFEPSTGGGEAPFTYAAKLQPARFNSFTREFYDAELGGMVGLNELFRRFYPRPSSRNVEVNPLRNNMPSWMPGSEYFINFQEGDPYSKIPYGEERLPGAGFAAYHPELKGVDPSKYPSWARYKILADVAPWSVQTRAARSMAYKDAGNNAYRIADLQEIDAQAEQQKQRKRFQELSFSEDTERIRGTISYVTRDMKFGLEEFPNHEFSFSGADFSINKVADHLRNINRGIKTRAEAVERAASQRSKYIGLFVEGMAGRGVSLKIHKGGLNRPDVEAEMYAGPVSVNKTLIDFGYAAPTGGRESANFIERLYGKAVETITHLPQKVPGPFWLNTKLTNEMTAIESYRKEELYGESFQPWATPWKSFIRPMIYRGIAAATPGDFIPPHVEQQRAGDVLYDRLEFMRAVQNNQIGKAMRTMAGADPMGNEQMLRSALPSRDRPYFTEFVKETDPSARKEILGMVSRDMQRALMGQWTKQYNQVTGTQSERIPTSARIHGALAMAVQEVKATGRNIPGEDWIGWNQNVDFEDVKAVHIQHTGMDHHDFNIWDDRIQALNRKPYLEGSHEALTSRLPAMDPFILSRGMSMRSGQMTIASERLSHNLMARFNNHHQIDYTENELDQYYNERERLIG